MAVNLIRHLERLVARVENQQFTGAADAMAGALRDGVTSAMGDLTFSGGAGTARIEGDAERGRVVVRASGAYGLADTGRRQVVPASASGRALRTPWGPRRSVRGSTWGGFGITDRYGRDAIRAGIRAAVDEVDWGR